MGPKTFAKTLDDIIGIRFVYIYLYILAWDIVFRPMIGQITKEEISCFELIKISKLLLMECLLFVQLFAISSH